MPRDWCDVQRRIEQMRMSWLLLLIIRHHLESDTVAGRHSSSMDQNYLWQTMLNDASVLKKCVKVVGCSALLGIASDERKIRTKVRFHCIWRVILNFIQQQNLFYLHINKLKKLYFLLFIFLGVGL